MAKHTVAAGAVLAVACVVTGCGTATTLDAASPPPLLRLVDNGLVDNGAPALGAPAAAGDGGGFVLRTTLPTSRPAPARVYSVPQAGRSDAATVAAALGLREAPVAARGGWAARSGSNLLAVRTDGSWTYGLDCSPSQPISSESLDVMCATAGVGTVSGSTPPPPPPAGPSAARTRELAAPILDRLGMTPTGASVTVGAPDSTTVAAATVEGLHTSGRETALSFDGSGRLVSGSGWVGTPAPGRAYPLIDASRAFALLRAQPRPMPMICRPLPRHRPGCAPWPPTVVTGAKLGLALRHERTRPLLVPAWLFQVQGSAPPLAVVAVDPKYLAQPATASGTSTAGSSTRG